MKRNKCFVILSVILLISILFTWYTLTRASFYREVYTGMGIRMKSSAGVKEDDLLKALEQEEKDNPGQVPSVTAWLTKGAKIENTFLNRKVKVMAVVTAGDMRHTVPSSLIEGNYVYREDYKGCIIDSATAYSLFGSLRVIGNQLSYNNKSYYIRGVVKASVPLVMIQGFRQSQAYPNLEFHYKSNAMAEASASAFLQKYGLTGSYTGIDESFYGRALSSFLVLPIWLLYAFISFFSFRLFIRNRRELKPVSFLGLAGIFLLTVLGFGSLLFQYGGSPFYLPEKIIPTKWSDFDYWINLGKTIKQQISDMDYLTPNPRDILLKKGLSNLWLHCSLLILLYLHLLNALNSCLKDMKGCR